MVRVFDAFISIAFLINGLGMAWYGAFFCFSTRYLPRLSAKSVWNPRRELPESAMNDDGTLTLSYKVIGTGTLLIAPICFYESLRFARYAFHHVHHLIR
jgi:hypothetical protein